MNIVKIVTAASVATLMAGSAIAGGFAQEIVEPVVVVEPEAETSSWGIILPLAALGLLVALAASSDDEEETTAE